MIDFNLKLVIKYLALTKRAFISPYVVYILFFCFNSYLVTCYKTGHQKSVGVSNE